MPKLAFKTIDSNYSTSKISGGCAPYEHQCAIRMSSALRKSGFNMDDFKGTNTCDAKGVMHVRGAESLANYFWKKQGRPKIFSSKEGAKRHVKGKTGIIFFKDITTFRGGRGDHIDVWNKTKMKKGSFYNAKQYWFWELR